ncbi:MAG: SDR family oxidoreductase [Acidaminococcaceae bacterium]|nr:SDR family oxidoreductase [Acidaminococcaceae bacterium]
MTNNLQGKTGVISGGTSGIGLATAKILLEKGARVIIVGRDRVKGQEAATYLGSQAAFVQADLSMVRECQKAAGAILKVTDKSTPQTRPVQRQLDFLVNCAGTYEEERPEQITEEAYERVLNNNLKSTIFLTKELLPSLAKEAAIVNVASDAGISGNYGCSLYSAAKGAVVAFTRSLALDLAPYIRVNCVCPGDVDTPLVAKQLAAGSYTKEEMAAVYPLGRIATPEEIARVIAFVLSPENSFMTGAIIPIDGGLTAK